MNEILIDCSRCDNHYMVSIPGTIDVARAIKAISKRDGYICKLCSGDELSSEPFSARFATEAETESEN